MALEVLLRYYTSGHTLLSRFLVQEAQNSSTLQAALQIQVTLFDRLVRAVIAEYLRTANAKSRSDRLADRIRQLVYGDATVAPEVDYNFSAHHVGIVAEGFATPDDLRRTIGRFGARLLLVRPGEHLLWAWIGTRDPLDPSSVVDLEVPPSATIGVGEPRSSIGGWRLTHRQAQAAFLVARGLGHQSARYREVALVASGMHDSLLASSLRAMYMEPIAAAKNSATLRETLGAYFHVGRNAASAAAALGVTRQTVATRLRTVEARIGRNLQEAGADLEVALRLESLRHGSNPPHS